MKSQNSGRAAIIDCGTNTFHLLVAEYEPNGSHRMLVNEKRNVKLGEGGMISNQIAAAPFERGINAFSELAQLARSFNPAMLTAFATSAIRGACNGQDFVRQVFANTGVQIRVIPGYREAELISKGVMLAMGEVSNTSLIMDIGGGSTEFILIKGKQVLWKQSFELGVSRLLQTLRPSDPITDADIKKLHSFFESTLEPLTRQISIQEPRLLIGCSGSFESLASMILRQRNGQELPWDIRSYAFDKSDYQSLHRKLLASSESQRLQMPGLVEARVDTIVYASVFIQWVRQRYSIPEMAFSNYALKEGALAEIISGELY